MMRKKLIPLWTMTAIFVLLIICISNQDEEWGNAPFSILVELGEKREEIACWMNSEGEAYIFLPGGVRLETALVKKHSSAMVSIDGRQLYSGMLCDVFQLDKPYLLEYEGMDEKEHSVRFVQSAKIATMFIDTESGSMEYIHAKKGNEEAGELRLYLENGVLSYDGKIQEVNGRGNNTWAEFKKKAYSLKLEENANLLGMGAAEKWVLLSNADDPTHMRNKAVFDLAKEVGLPFSPQAQWVDVYLNGTYSGIYLLCERNEVHDERVIVPPENGWLVSLEDETRLKSQQYSYVKTDSGQALRIHYPQTVTSKEKEIIQKQWQEIEDAFERLAEGCEIENDLGNLIDLESWVKKYVIEEIFAGPDSCLLSQFFYFDGNVVYAGPVWDYDHTLGHNRYWQLSSVMTMYANRERAYDGVEAPWFGKLYTVEEFEEEMVETFVGEYLQHVIPLAEDGLYDYFEKISQSVEMDKKRWQAQYSLIEEVEFLSKYLIDRVQFLTELWVKKEPYHLVQVNAGNGEFIGYFCVRDGELFTELPRIDEAYKRIYGEFIGWYYDGSMKQFDTTVPICEDVSIRGKWERVDPMGGDAKVSKILRGCFFCMLIVLLAIEFSRKRKGV